MRLLGALASPWGSGRAGRHLLVRSPAIIRHSGDPDQWEVPHYVVAETCVLRTMTAMSHVTQDLVTSIDERLAHARAEIASLEAALAVFDTPAVPVGERQPTRGQLTDITPTAPPATDRDPPTARPRSRIPARRAHAHGISPAMVTWTPHDCRRCSPTTTD